MGIELPTARGEAMTASIEVQRAWGDGRMVACRRCHKEISEFDAHWAITGEGAYCVPCADDIWKRIARSLKLFAKEVTQ